MRDFEQELKQKTEYAEEVTKRYLPEAEGFQKTVIGAMNYSVLAGGKRLRPLLLAETYALFGGEGKLAEPFMAAIEMIHTYSLVHDDLPAMDNDEFRRGKFTTWKKYGDGIGILAGDGLLNYAFETALSSFSLCEGEEQTMRVVRALTLIAQKAGIYGMIGGQTADVEAEKQNEEVSFEKLMFIHAHKTAALLEAAMMCGAILAGAGEEDVDRIRECAYNVGIAFQIQDDILDVKGDEKELGKHVGSDAENHKQTYVTIKGMDQSEKDVRALSEKSVLLLDDIEGDSEFLKWLVIQLTDRRK